MDRKEKAQVKDITKKIQKGIRDNTRLERHEKLQNILEDFKGIKSIANVEIKRKSHHVYERRSWRHRSIEERHC